MLKELIGSAVGAKVAKRDGGSEAKGAAIGFFTPKIIAGGAKIGALAALGWGVVALAKRATR